MGLGSGFKKVFYYFTDFQLDYTIWEGLKGEHVISLQHCHLVSEDQMCKELSQSWEIFIIFLSLSHSPSTFVHLTLFILCFVHPLSHGQSPCYYRHVVSAHFCSGPHDVPKPSCSDVRLSPHTDRRWPGCAQRLLPELGYAGVPRAGPGYRSEHPQCLCYWTLMWNNPLPLYCITISCLVLCSLPDRFSNLIGQKVMVGWFSRRAWHSTAINVILNGIKYNVVFNILIISIVNVLLYCKWNETLYRKIHFEVVTITSHFMPNIMHCQFIFKCMCTLRCRSSGVPHSAPWHGSDPCFSGAATSSTARSPIYKWNS